MASMCVVLRSPPSNSGDCHIEWEKPSGDRLRESFKGQALPNLTVLGRDFWEVLEELEKVYANDAQTKGRGMSLQERLEFHQAESGAIMDGLLEWIKRQIEMKRVE